MINRRRTVLKALMSSPVLSCLGFGMRKPNTNKTIENPICCTIRSRYKPPRKAVHFMLDGPPASHCIYNKRHEGHPCILYDLDMKYFHEPEDLCEQYHRNHHEQ